MEINSINPDNYPEPYEDVTDEGLKERHFGYKEGEGINFRRLREYHRELKNLDPDEIARLGD